jgi:2-phosphosulfolactate phosphatase
MAGFRKPMFGQVIIDCFPASVAARYAEGYAIVAVDVIRATTMAVSAVESGRRCLCAASLDDAFHLAARLEQPLLAGELAGDMPAGFHLNNSPAELLRRADTDRPLVMLSSSGTQLMLAAARYGDAAYVACLRNYAATARYLAGRHRNIAVVGAGSRNEFREEDQMCCAWIAEALLNAGYAPGTNQTARIVERWSGAPPEACCISHSVDYLRRSGQMQDLAFVLQHVNDLDDAYTISGAEVLLAGQSVLHMFQEAA